MKYISIVLVLALLPVVSATIQLDAVSTDPVIISAGDNVDLIVEYNTGSNNEKYADPQWEYQVQLVADDDISAEYLLITDSYGDDVFGSLRAGGQYSKEFTIKVSEDAPAAKYELQLQGQWYKNGVLQEGQATQKVYLTVHKYGVLLDIANVQSQPQKIKAGDSDVALILTIANSGEKAATNTQIDMKLPEGFRPATSSNAQAYIGRIQPGETQEAVIHVDLDEDIASGAHTTQYTITYRDESQNVYERRITEELYVAHKPRIKVEQANTTIQAGKTAMLDITVRNTADVAAEAIDVRLLKESNQPFTLQTRSAYIGKLEPNQTATIQLEISADNDANHITHNVPILIRAKGDSQRNDNEVYTYRDQASITVEGAQTHNYVVVGVLAVILVLAGILWRTKK
jgi:hypothetical protein